MCDLLFLSVLIIWLAQTPEDPHSEQSEHTKYPVDHQLGSGALPKCLWKGKGKKINHCVEKDGQKEPASETLAKRLQHYHGKCYL